MVDTSVLGTDAARRGGSSPLPPTIILKISKRCTDPALLGEEKSGVKSSPPSVKHSGCFVFFYQRKLFPQKIQPKCQGVTPCTFGKICLEITPCGRSTFVSSSGEPDIFFNFLHQKTLC